LRRYLILVVVVVVVVVVVMINSMKKFSKIHEMIELTFFLNEDERNELE
jgi:hypothetical protein